jgi:Domain of unknown function (DUF4893)
MDDIPEKMPKFGQPPLFSTVTMNVRAFLLAIILSAGTLPAFADGEFDKLITAADRQRMEKYEETRAAALAEAKAGGAAGDLAALDAVAGTEPQSWSGFDMTGKWQCRTIKVGGALPVVVYGWFKCRVSDDGSGWMLEKTSGSQRTKGRFFDDGEKRLTYLGSFYVNDDPVKPYGSGADSDQFGYVFRTGARTFRIELPAPRYESKLDILEFRR